MIFFKSDLDILGPLNSPVNFRSSLPVSGKKKKPAEILIGVVLCLWISLGSTPVFIMLNHIHEHGRSFHYLGPLSFLSTVFYCCQSVSFGLLFPNYFIFPNASVN